MPAIPPDLYGPFGAVVFLAIAAIVLIRGILILWRDHLRADQDDREQRDRATRLLEAALAANREAVEANRLMAEAWDARNKADAARVRRNDPR